MAFAYGNFPCASYPHKCENVLSIKRGWFLTVPFFDYCQWPLWPVCDT